MIKIESCIFVLLTLISSISITYGQQFVEVSRPNEVLTLLKNQADKTISIQAEFKEEKHVTYLKEPQYSSGVFYYQKPERMRWEQLKPYPYSLVLSAERVLVKENGQTKDLSANAKVATRMKNTLLGLIRGDFQTSGSFSSKVLESKDAYQIILIPSDKRVRNYYEEIHMVFQKKTLVLQQLNFLEKKGNKTITRFYNEKLNQKMKDELFSAF